ncbi:hypothetical protein, partial [Brasilonema octagenarum]
MLRQGNELSLKPIPSTFYVLLVLNFFPNSTALDLINVITSEQVVEAARNAVAHDFISELAHGYETNVG